MAEAPRSNRPTPRTEAAVEAELRRRIRAELVQARSEAEGQLDDATLAAIIARAVATALGWHREAPEHTRNATLSSRSWRSAAGPRGGRQREEFEERSFEQRGPRDFRGPPRDFEDRPPRGPYRERGPYQERGRYQERGPRDFEGRDAFPRREAQGRPPFSPRSGGPPRGGFGPRRPPRGR